MVETKFNHTVYNFNSYASEMIDLYRMFNVKAALSYINNLTKGFEVTRFNRRGEFWYGTERSVYEKKKEIEDNFRVWVASGDEIISAFVSQ